MNSRLLRIFLAFSVIIISYMAEGQSSRVAGGIVKYKYLQIPGRIKIDKGDPSGTVVNLINLDTKQTEKSIVVPSSGKFDLELSYFKEYKITVTKDGYYDKKIDASTVIPRNVWDKDSIFPPFYIVITLYKKVEGVVLSFEGKTIGKVSYSPNGTLDNFDSKVLIDDQLIQDEINEALKNKDDKVFNQKVAEALEYEKKDDLSNAYSSYSEAIKLKPSDKFVKEKLKELASDLKNLLGEAKILAEFNRLIALGDANVSSLKYTDAILNFKGALKIKPNDPVAVSKLADAEKLLAMAGEKAKEEAEFNRLIAAGDASVTQTKYAEAITSFKSALTIKPGDSRTLARIADAEKLIAMAGDNAKKEAEFDRLIAAGDASVTQTKYAEAITSFKSALTIKPSDSMALARIADTEKLLAMAGEKAKEEAEFNRLIAAGDASVTQTKYAEAITSFKSALTIKPGDSMALARIADAEKLLAMAGEKAKEEAEFNRLIAAGDASVTQTKYAEGITSFKSALTIKPGNSIALARFADAEKLLAMAGEKAKEEAEFNRLIAAGDASVTQTKYAEAITSFKSALTIKPGDSMALARIADAEKLLAMAGEKAKTEAEFDRLIAAGDVSVTQTKYAEGITSFKSALTIKPGDSRTLARIADAEKLLAMAGEKAKTEAEFNRLIAAGDASVTQTKYAEGITSFKSALTIKPGDSMAMARIADAEKLLAMAGEKAKEEAEFDRLIATGDAKVTQTKYAEAITSFKSALTIKPGDSRTLARIADAEKLIAMAGDKAKKEAEFDRLIAAGDTKVKVKEYTEALSLYNRALSIISNEMVNSKIRETQSLIDGLAAKTLADQKSALDDKLSSAEKIYLEKIKTADENFIKSQWTVARFYFIEALKVKQSDKYALGKVDACDKMIDSGITAEKMLDYKNRITRGDDEMKGKNYSVARFYYKGASDILKWEAYPQQQLKEIDRIVAEQLNESDQRLFKENLAKADDAFNRKEYPTARFYYNKVIELSQSDHVTSRLTEIESILNGSELKKINIAYEDFVKKGEDAVKQNNNAIARFYFQKAIALKPGENFPRQELLKIDSAVFNP